MLKLHFIGYYPVTRMFNTVIYFSRYQLQEKKTFNTISIISFENSH